MQDAVSRWLPYVVDQDIIRRQNVKGKGFVPTPYPCDADAPPENEAPEETRGRALRTLQGARHKAMNAISSYRRGR